MSSPDRFVAEREVMAFVALAVHLHDLCPEDAERAKSRMDETKSTLGAMDPVKADEVILVILPRSQARESVGRKRWDWVAVYVIT